VLGVAIGTFFPSSTDAAVTFSVSPSTISNTYSGVLTLQIGGLSSGESVVVQKYWDANGNSVIDAPDTLAQQFQLTDGQMALIGAATNINVPSDSTAADGAITARLSIQPGDIAQTLVSKFAFRLSSPSNHFNAITNVLTVTNFGYAQRVTGSVKSSGTNVPYATVILFSPHGEGMNPVGGTIADSAGGFTIKAPPGIYSLGAIKSNYVGDLSASSGLILSTGAVLTTNLNLAPATRTISGKLVDATNASLGLPALLVPVHSSNNLLTVAFTDSNGNFSAPVISGGWEFEADSHGLSLHGYLRPGNSPQVDTSTGSVSGLTIAYPKANALFYGTVKDGSGNPLAGVDLHAGDNMRTFSDDGPQSDPNGNYAAGALAAGPWQAGVSSDGNLSFSNYVFSESSAHTFSVGEALRDDFTALLATNHVTGHVQYQGQPVTNVGVSAFASINGQNFQSQTTTDNNGDYSLNLPNGDWSVNLYCQGGKNSLDDAIGSGLYQCPSSLLFTLNNNSTNANFTVLPPDALLSGRVVDDLGNPVTNISIFASPDGGGGPGPGASTDSNGHYQMGISAGSYTVQLNSDPVYGAPAFGLITPSLPLTITNGANVTGFNLVARTVTATITLTVTNLSSHTGVGGIYVNANSTLNGTNYYAGQQTDGSGNAGLKVCNGTWTNNADCFGLSQAGLSCPTNGGITVTISGNNTNVIFAVQPCHLQITTPTALPDAQLGQFYSFSFTAATCQGFTSWSATNLPYGLFLDNFGNLSGVLNSAGSNYFYVQVSDGSTNVTAGFSLVVQNTGCILTCPADLYVQESAGQCGAFVFYNPPITNGTCGNTVCSPPSLSFFPVGSTLVTCTNDAGSSCSFSIIVTRTDPPSVTLNGPAFMNSECHTSFTDPGAMGSDSCVGLLPVITNGSVNPNVPGYYLLQYVATGPGGQSATNTRTVRIVDTIPPVVTILGPNPATNECHVAVQDPGATASDSCAGNLAVLKNNAVNPNVPGMYSITYTATDPSGNSATIVRTVYVVDTTPPTVTLLGSTPMTVLWNGSFADPGASASDLCSGANIVLTTNGTVDVATPGSYLLAYVATDPSGNSATNTRVVNVITNQVPGITSQPAGLVTNAGSAVTFSVSASGGDLTYQWLKNGSPLNDGGNVSGASSPSLTLSNLLHADAASYRVTVSNLLGSTNSDLAVLSVIDPAILTQPADTAVLAGALPSFQVQAAGTPNLMYQWYTVTAGHAIKLTGKTNATLTLTPATTAMAGNYFVTVSNQLPAPNSVTSALAHLTVYLRPTITITAPRTGQSFNIDLVHASGKASNNVGVASVWYQLNNGPWLQASGASSWTADLSALIGGTNVLRLFSLDTGGNPSLTNKVSFKYVPSDRLNLAMVGRGTLSPHYSNALLQIGRTYCITSTPAAGLLFSNWTGGVFVSDVLSNGPVLRFIMQSNLSLTATAVTNPFTIAKGSYNGLFTTDAGREQASSGAFNLTVGSTGTGSGSMRTGNKTNAFATRFNLVGNSTATVARPGTNPVALHLTLDLNGGNVVTGTVDAVSWQGSVVAYRSVFNSITNPAIAFTNRYTVAIAGTNGDTNLPAGDGFATISLATSGKATVAGKLGDGTPISLSVPISEDGDAPVYVSLYAGKGSLYSWLHFDTNPPASVSGLVSWIKPSPSSAPYTNGFNFITTANGSVYQQPPPGQQVISMTDGLAVFEGSDVNGLPVTNTVFLTTGNALTNTTPTTNALTFSLTRSNGVFTGTVRVPGTSKTLTYQGVFLQNSNAAYGYFKGTNQSGALHISPP
jgi:hypothetical protein